MDKKKHSNDNLLNATQYTQYIYTISIAHYMTKHSEQKKTSLQVK